LQFSPVFAPKAFAIVGVFANSIEDGAVLHYCLPSNTHTNIALFSASINAGFLAGSDLIIIFASSFLADLPAMITSIFAAVQSGLCRSLGVKAVIVSQSFILNSRISSDHLTSNTSAQGG